MKYMPVTLAVHGRGLLLWCPGCEETQIIDQRWSWEIGGNGALTVEPSILLTGGRHPDHRCHAYIRNGAWEFLPDSTHALAGQTVPVVDIPPEVFG